MSTKTTELSLNIPSTENDSPPALADDNAEIVPDNSDINDILNRIRIHLNRFNKLDNVNLNEPTETLNLGNTQISVDCVIHYLSGNADFLADRRADCSRILADYLTDDRIDLQRLIDIANDDPENEENFLRDSRFYRNLYNFNLSLASFVANDERFQGADPETQRRILAGIQSFAKQSVNYLSRYMEKYGVIDDKLLNSSYNLMYLMNTLTLRQANVGRSVQSITDLYQRLVASINQNIQLYNQIDKDKLTGSIGDATVSEANAGIDGLYGELTRRLAAIEKQRTELEANVTKINQNSSQLETLASDEAKSIVQTIRSRIGGQNS